MNKTFVIAEMACSHEGDPNLAISIIDAAGIADADAIQFQIYKRDERAIKSRSDWDVLGQVEFSENTWKKLAKYSRDRYPKMEIIACIYECQSVDLSCEIGVDAFKIHSADLSNPQLLKYVCQTGKRIDLSTGASTLDEVEEAITTIENYSTVDIWLMFGIQNFPTPTHAARLKYLQTLKQHFGKPVGYQDHTDANYPSGFWLPAASMGLGIEILEKHITHDRSKRGVDSAAALNPDEFKLFVEMVRVLDEAIGDGLSKPFSEEELKYRRYVKKSCVTSVPLPKGTRLHNKYIKFMFAEEPGIPPNRLHHYVGKRVNRDIESYEAIFEQDFS
jgi:N,N'-diacetyllegionaminate synthase